jgi:hypothetical protein
MRIVCAQTPVDVRRYYIGLNTALRLEPVVRMREDRVQQNTSICWEKPVRFLKVMDLGQQIAPCLG